MYAISYIHIMHMSYICAKGESVGMRIVYNPEYLILYINVCDIRFQHCCFIYSLSVSTLFNFGRGVSPLLPQDIKCSGEETQLSDCNVTLSDSTDLQCSQVAGVICEGVHVR